MDKQHRLSRLGPLSGLLAVALEFGGVILGSQPMVALGDSNTKILNALTKHVGTGAWIGSYMELATLAAFAVFAIWLFGSRRGPLAGAGMLATGVYVTVGGISLIVGDVLKYGSGHGMGHQEMLALFDLQSALFIATWGISAAFLALAPVSGWLRGSALVIAGLRLVSVTVPTAGAAQFPEILFLLWIVAVGVSAGRRPSTVTAGAPAAAHA
jgi:hypothetical protein